MWLLRLGGKIIKVYLLYRNYTAEVDMMLSNSIPSKKGKGLISDNKNNRHGLDIFYAFYGFFGFFYVYVFNAL